MRIVRRGAKEQVLASEALVINRPNKHANIQAGGGPLRGLSQEELIKRADLSAGYETSANWRRAQGTSTQQLALIAATGAALAACAFFGYQWYKKSKSKRRRESDFGASTTNTRRAASAEGTTEAAEADAGRHADSRRAKFKELRKLNLQVIGLLALQMTVAAIATAVGD
jgi:hypothetical protein